MTQKWIPRVLIGFVLLIALFFGVLFLMGGAKGKGYHEAVIVIDRPPAQVFPWLTEPDKLKQWIGGLTESTALTEGNLRVGARSREVVALGEDRTEMEVEITALELNKLLGTRINSAGFEGDTRYTLEDEAGKTRLRYTGDFRYTDFMARLLEPLITPAAQRKLEQDLAHLKSLIETNN